MIGFLLSLMWVDQHQQRSGPVSSPSMWSPLAHWTTLREPQQRPDDSTWTTTDNSGASVLANNHRDRPDHKSRRVAKREISDAFEMRGRVLLALTVWVMLGIMSLSYMLYWLYNRLTI